MNHVKFNSNTKNLLSISTRIKVPAANINESEN
jgi:hypothetical protein